MPFNGQGTFTPKHTWVTEANQGTPMLPAEFDDQDGDFATGLSNAILRDGTGGPTADIPWNNFGITGLRAPALSTDAANKAYVDTATSARSMGGYQLNNVATPSVSTDAANMDYVLQVAMNAALPNQSGQAGKFVGTDGTNAGWYNPLNVFRSARTSNTILAAADKGTLIDITSGTFTQTFTAAATLGAGWYVWLRNAGTGDITVDPNGTELIDGLTSYVMYPGEARLVQCDGTQFTTVVIHGFNRTFTSSGSFTKPPGYTYFSGEAWGGGGSGACTADTSGNTLASAGGGGACVPFTIPSSALSSSTTVTIGAGGAAVNGANLNGNQGGSTVFGTVTAYGGGPGQTGGLAGGSGGGATAAGSGGGATSQGGGSPSFGAPGVGFEGGGGLNNSTSPNSMYGGSAGGGASVSNAYNGGNAVAGGAGGGAAATNNAANGGTSKLGGNGGAGGKNIPGTDGAAPAGGGGASFSTTTGTYFSSGAGARGELRIRGIV